MTFEDVCMIALGVVMALAAAVFYVGTILLAFDYAIRWPLVIVWAVMMICTAMEKYA